MTNQVNSIDTVVVAVSKTHKSTDRAAVWRRLFVYVCTVHCTVINKSPLTRLFSIHFVNIAQLLKRFIAIVTASNCVIFLEKWDDCGRHDDGDKRAQTHAVPLNFFLNEVCFIVAWRMHAACTCPHHLFALLWIILRRNETENKRFHIDFIFKNRLMCAEQRLLIRMPNSLALIAKR